MTPRSLPNPILPGLNPDPTIVRVGTDYFICTSTFEYFPGLPIYHSRNLADWKLLGHALNRKSQLNMRTVESGGGIFAPSLRHHKGRFYLSCCACYRVPNFENLHKGLVGPRGFYVWTDNIWAGHWSDPVYFDTLGIDQDLFFDDNDRVYLTLTTILPKHLTPGGFGIGVYGLEIDLESGRSLSAPRLLRQSKHGRGIAEGSHVFKKDGWYYLLTAEGGTEVDHQEWVFRSKGSPLGPWEPCPSNPVLYNGLHATLQQTGHMDLVDDGNGQWFAVFLGVRGRIRDGIAEWSPLGRESFISKVQWLDGWPVVNDGKPVELDDKPRGTIQYPFDPAGDWYHLRTPLTDDCSFDAKPGVLTLRGSAYTLDLDESPAALFQRQIAFQGTFAVKLDFRPLPNERVEAGVVVWWHGGAYASLGLRADGSLHLKSSQVDGDAFEMRAVGSVSSVQPVKLEIRASRDAYIFFADGLGEIGRVPVEAIVRDRPVDSKNVAVMFGLYAQGLDGWPARTPAYFSDCSWTDTSQT